MVPADVHELLGMQAKHDLQYYDIDVIEYLGGRSGGGGGGAYSDLYKYAWIRGPELENHTLKA